MNDPGSILKILAHAEEVAASHVEPTQGLIGDAPRPPVRIAIDDLLMAGSWNILDQSGLKVLLACERLGVSVHNAGIFGAGFVFGSNMYRYGAAAPELVARRATMQTICAESGTDLVSVAVLFAALPSCVTKLVVGVASCAEADLTFPKVHDVLRHPPGSSSAADAALRRMVAVGLVLRDDTFPLEDQEGRDAVARLRRHFVTTGNVQ